jgi:hypothetical protein
MEEKELHNRLYPEAAAKAEYIICAAIHYNDGKTYLHQPKNIDSGIVVCGRRHHNIIYNWNQLSLGKTRRTDTEGFLTSKDRFVDRKEGGRIAFEAGQIKKITDCLFSEDLY